MARLKNKNMLISGNSEKIIKMNARMLIKQGVKPDIAYHAAVNKANGTDYLYNPRRLKQSD